MTTSPRKNPPTRSKRDFKVPYGLTAWLARTIPKVNSTDRDPRYAYVCGYRAIIDLIGRIEQEDNT